MTAAAKNAAGNAESNVTQNPSVEERTRAFYDSEGWVADETGVSGEDRLFRHDAAARGSYAGKVEAKAATLLAGRDGTVLFAGPGDFPESHERVAQQFSKAICVDISEKSLEICRGKLGAKADCRNGSLLDLPLADNSVDAALCAHVLFHIDKNHQERCVAELLRVVRPGGRVVIVYVNPQAPLMRVQRLLKALRVNQLLKADQLYYFSHPLSWWRRFESRAAVSFVPYDVMSRRQERALLPVAALRRRCAAWAGSFEDRKPAAAARLWTYLAIQLDKR
jgi:SAM-dependent methyltransferase